MASESGETLGLDDIMATLMTMGFEFKDCQDAITNGKLTVQAAVEWILSGKPNNVVSDQPTLTLNQNPPQPAVLSGDRSNPFVERNFNPLIASNQTSASVSAQSADIDMTDSSVVSRSQLSGKQQQIKQDFEEKERIAARKKVQEEKRKQKLEKERILKEIQADREKVKLTKQTKPNDSVQVKPSTQNEPQVTTSTPSSQTDGKSDESTLIQVRLPSGEMFRQTFLVSATLNNVWDAVYNKIKTAMLAHEGFIQPFPRREFLKEEMNQTLKDLGLTPSGSLVLKKKSAEQASVDPPNNDPGVAEQEMQIADNVERDEEEEEDYENDVAMEERNVGHNWGRGFRVDEDNPEGPMDIANVAQAVAHNPFDNDDDDDMFDEDQAEQAFEGYGMRLVPEGVPADDGHHLRRRAGDMAAEAAAQRFAQPPPVVVPEPSRSQSELKYHAHSLQDLGMTALARRITDPRTPIFSMNGLSNDLLQIFLTYLKKEKLLNPKVLLLMPSYLVKLNLDFYSYTTNELLHSARVLVNLHHLSLNSCSLITDAGLSSLKGMKALKYLSLQNCSQITDCCLSALSELTSLQSLNLEATKVTNKGISQFASSGACPQLTHLNIGRTSITHAIIPSLTKFEHLKSLCLKQNRVGSLSGIESISNLESLDVSDTDIVSDSVLCLTGLPYLKQVCLSGSQELVGDTALFYMKDLNLTSLVLPCRVRTTDVGMSYITGFALSALDLTNYTNVGDAGMLSVGQITSLKTLVLTNTRITNEGLLCLAGLVNLEVLFVDKTVVSGAGLAVVDRAQVRPLPIGDGFVFTQGAPPAIVSREIQMNNYGACAENKHKKRIKNVTSDFLKQGVLNNCLMLSKLNLSRTIVGDRGLQFLKIPNLALLNLDCTRAHEYIESTIRSNCPNIKHITFANLSTVPEDEEV